MPIQDDLFPKRPTTSNNLQTIGATDLSRLERVESHGGTVVKFRRRRPALDQPDQSDPVPFNDEIPM